jgi:uncharacterized protein
MNLHTKKRLIDGPAGKIELAIDAPDEVREQELPARGVVLIAHPHPLFGGTMNHKVVHTLARAFIQLGYVAFRPNFRGVGQTEGKHDNGIGEQDDVLAVVDHIRSEAAYTNMPLALAGFSFGTVVLSHVAARLQQQDIVPQRLVFVGTAASRWTVAVVPEDTIVIHGELDEIVPLQAVYDWARPQILPIIVVPGADHFFHRKLPLLKRIVTDSWHV